MRQLNRAADITAKLVAIETCRPSQPTLLFNVIKRIQRATAIVLKALAVVTVSTRLSDHVDLGARVSPKLDAVGIGLQPEFLNRFRDNWNSSHRNADIIVVGTVDTEIVIASSLTVHRDTR